MVRGERSNCEQFGGDLGGEEEGVAWIKSGGGLLSILEIVYTC